MKSGCQDCKDHADWPLDAFLKPFPSEHACRLRDPGDFQPDSFRRVSRESGGKRYAVIMGKLTGDDAMTEQSYRYPTADWTVAEARSHCSRHDGIAFEPAADADKDLPVALLKQAFAELKEGRVLSTATRDRLSKHPSTLRELADDIDALVTETAPPEKGRALWLEWQRNIAQVNRALVQKGGTSYADRS
jgi:hypothetical protein